VLRLVLVAAFVMALVSLRAERVQAVALVTVNSNADTNDGSCTADPGGCTLREAINAANAEADLTTINFAIPGTGPHTIFLGSNLPAISTQTVLDATTQSGWSKTVRTPMVAVDGQNLRTFCLHVTADQSTVKGLAVMRCTVLGILVEGDLATIEANFVGVDPTGLIDMGNAEGILLTNASDALIHFNLISGNTGWGLRVLDAAGFIETNRIGTDRFGLKAIANGGGIQTQGTPPGFLGSVRIGNSGSSYLSTGMPNAQGNLISGNTGVAIQIDSSDTLVSGNLIGTDITGSRLIANGGGVAITGLDAGVGNRADPEYPGQYICSDGCNVVAGAGINVSADSALVQANFIGTDKTGQHAFGSPAEGIFVAGSSNYLAHNLILNSASDGIRIFSGIENNLLANSVYQSAGLGIDLDTNGVDPNDPGDGDSGANHRLNAPSISSITAGPTNMSITGTLDVAPGFYIIHVFGSPGCDFTGFGEGRMPFYTYIVSPGPFLINIPVAGLFDINSSGRVIALTATNNYLTSPDHDTSEFSNCFSIPACAGDTECDGYADPAATHHIGQLFTSPTTSDNCPFVWNRPQWNTDGNFIVQVAPASQNDRTAPMSDALGDACDSDDDNDGISSLDEMNGTSCGGVRTSLLVLDSDFDRFHDGIECSLGTDPLSPLSKPGGSPGTTVACGPSGDTDGDRLADRIEVCAYNTNPNAVDSDGDMALDGARDGCEAASFNLDRIVNAGDQLMLATEITRVSSGTYFEYGLGPVPGLDINKDGAVNSGDQLLLAPFIATPGQCP
jgi:CSLREA domain-containing protein